MNITDHIPEFRGNIINHKGKGFLMSLDIGLKKIGVAKTDLLWNIAFPYKLIEAKNKLKDIAPLFEEAIGIIIGYPKKFDGQKSELNNFIDEFIKVNIPSNLNILLYNEILTTRIANDRLRSVGMNRKKRNEVDDIIAAQIMLEEIIDKIKY